MEQHWTIALTERRQFYQFFMEVPAGVAAVRGPDHVVDFVNRPYLDMFGRQAADGLAGRRLRDVLPELDGQGYVAWLDRVYATGQPFASTEMMVKIDCKSDGTLSERFFSLLFLPTRLAGGAVDGVLIQAIDVTDSVRARQRTEDRSGQITAERKEAAAQRQVNTELYSVNTELSLVNTELHLINTELHHAADRQNALRQQAEARVIELEELDRRKDEFIAIASHELKSPLTSIKGYTQLLLRRVRGPNPDPVLLARELAVIESQATALTRLLDDLLDASRVQMGTLELRPAPCGLEECLAAVLARLNPEERDRVEVVFADAPLAGTWEQRKIAQVLANLVGNALKYSPVGAPVRIAATSRAGEIEVAVSDRGMGIPPEDLPLVFERFHRTQQARDVGLTGTGLGLYICRGIIDAHGGRLWAESAGVGRGATFRFTLPVPAPDGNGRITSD